jgi:hypothetical protein
MVTQLLRVSSIIFLGPTLFTFSIKIFSCRVREGAGECLPHATKKEYGLMGEKRDAAFHLRVFRYAPDRAVFSAAANKKQTFKRRKKENVLLIFFSLLHRLFHREAPHQVPFLLLQ